jgi:hypothetical protein
MLWLWDLEPRVAQLKLYVIYTNPKIKIICTGLNIETISATPIAHVVNIRINPWPALTNAPFSL